MSNRYTRQEWRSGHRFRERTLRGAVRLVKVIVGDAGPVAYHCLAGRHSECLAHTIDACTCPCHESQSNDKAS